MNLKYASLSNHWVSVEQIFSNRCFINSLCSSFNAVINAMCFNPHPYNVLYDDYVYYLNRILLSINILRKFSVQ